MPSEHAIESRRRLPERTLLINVANAKPDTEGSALLVSSLVEAWRDIGWPIVHFVPESGVLGAGVEKQEFLKANLIRPGALLFESATISIWTNKQFCEFHHDIGAEAIIILGRKVDCSVVAIAVGAAKRTVPVAFISCRGDNLDEYIDYYRYEFKILTNIAVEVSAQDVLADLKERGIKQMSDAKPEENKALDHIPTQWSGRDLENMLETIRALESKIETVNPTAAYFFRMARIELSKHAQKNLYNVKK